MYYILFTSAFSIKICKKTTRRYRSENGATFPRPTALRTRSPLLYRPRPDKNVIARDGQKVTKILVFFEFFTSGKLETLFMLFSTHLTRELSEVFDTGPHAPWGWPGLTYFVFNTVAGSLCDLSGVIFRNVKGLTLTLFATRPPWSLCDL